MIFYVTKDIERAVGIDLKLYPDVFFISNDSLLAQLVYKQYSSRILVNRRNSPLFRGPTFVPVKVGTTVDKREKSMNDYAVDNQFNTLELLKEFKKDIECLSADTTPKIMVFKNTPQIERFCEEQGWDMLNPDASLGKRIENKMTQYAWLREKKSIQLEVLTPKTTTGELQKFDFEDLEGVFGVPFIIQYNTGHTGSGTKLITSSREWINEAKKFPKREVKVSKYFDGGVYTVNACVIPDTVFVGEVSLQMTGIPELTDNPFATVGNDWGVASCELTGGQVNQIKNIVQKVGSAMREDGWKGLFGIDVIVENETGDVYLIEINARQPQSASFETILAHEQGVSGPLDWHLSALKRVSHKTPAIRYKLSESQIFSRKDVDNLPEKYQKVIQNKENKVNKFI